MKRIIPILFLALLGLGSACQPATPTLLPEPTAIPTPSPTPTQSVPPEAVAWLQAHAFHFETAEPGNGCADLEPLLEMIGEARVVALGEATHGTHEFFTMKHRILECLVQEKGFNVFAMEEGWAEANHINAYVQALNETSNPVGTLRFMGSGEVDDMIEWMRQYNDGVGAGSKVSLRGFDMQYADLIVEDILAYVQAVDPGNMGTVQENLDCFLKHVKNWSADPTAELYSQAGEEIQSLCRQGLQNIQGLFLENRAVYQNISSPAEFAGAFQLVNLVMQNEQLMAASTLEESINLRDRYMAENVAWLLNEAGPDAKMVISAHNGHVTFSSDTWQTEEGETEMVWMGVHLKKMLGDDLVVVGFGFNHGSFRAIGFSSATGNSLGYSVFKITSPIQDSHETYLSMAHLRRFFLDLRPMRTDPELVDWFLEPRWLTEFGLGYVVDDPVANATQVVLPDEFDILIYFEETSASLP